MQNEISLIGNNPVVDMLRNNPQVIERIKSNQDRISQMTEGGKMEYLQQLLPGIEIAREGFAFIFDKLMRTTEEVNNLKLENKVMKDKYILTDKDRVILKQLKEQEVKLKVKDTFIDMLKNDYQLQYTSNKCIATSKLNPDNVITATIRR